MIKATLRSPATDAAASQAVRQAVPTATQQPASRPAAPTAQPQQRAAVASRLPAGVVTPRGAAPVVSAPQQAQPLQAAPRVLQRTPPVQAPAPVTPRAPAQPVAAPQPPAQPQAPATPTTPAKTRKPRTPKAPANPPAEVIPQTVATPDGGTLETINTVAAPADNGDAELFGGAAEQPPIDVVAEVTPVEDPAAQPPAEPYPTEAAEPVQGEEQFQQVAQTSALAVRAPSAVATRSQYGDAAGGLEGDWGSEDLRFPQLKVVQGKGQLAAQFDDGTVIYADQILFPPASLTPGVVNPLLYFVPISIKKQWREKLSQDQVKAGEVPRTADTVEEVEELGGTTQWIGNQQPSWGPSARCLLLLEQPEGSDHPNFSTLLDGRNYGVAVYYSAGAAFNNFSKIIFNTGLTSLQVPIVDEAGQPILDAQNRIQKRTMLYKNYWTVQWQKKKSGEFLVWTPSTRILGAEVTGPEVRQYIETLLNSRQSFKVADDQ